MDTETYNAYKDLGKEATSLEEIAELRAMAAKDAGDRIQIVVQDEETGKSEIVDVKSIGHGTLAALDHEPIQLAEASAGRYSNDH